MPTVLALPLLYEAVVDRFDDEGTMCVQSFGWLEPPKLGQANARITWTPGDVGGALGDVVEPRQPGRNPRPIGTLHELCTVEIYAYDPASPTSELAQYTACRLLFDAWYRAVYLAARGTFEVQSSEWIRPKSGRSHGACIRVVMRVDAMLPDAEYELAPTPMAADLDVALLDHEETITTEGT